VWSQKPVTADAMPPGRSEEERKRERRRIEDENEVLLCRLQALDAQLEHLDAEENGGEGNGPSAREGERARRRLINSQVVRVGQGKEKQRRPREGGTKTEKQWMADGRIMHGGAQVSHSAPEAMSLGAASLLNNAMVTRACSCVRRCDACRCAATPSTSAVFREHCSCRSSLFSTIFNHPSVPLVCSRCAPAARQTVQTLSSHRRKLMLDLSERNAFLSEQLRNLQQNSQARRREEKIRELNHVREEESASFAGERQPKSKRDLPTTASHGSGAVFEDQPTPTPFTVAFLNAPPSIGERFLHMFMDPECTWMLFECSVLALSAG